jgi:hypothetical protein
MLHGRHDRKSNAVAGSATVSILCDQDEFGKTIGKTTGKTPASQLK